MFIFVVDLHPFPCPHSLEIGFPKCPQMRAESRDWSGFFVDPIEVLIF